MEKVTFVLKSKNKFNREVYYVGLVSQVVAHAIDTCGVPLQDAAVLKILTSELTGILVYYEDALILAEETSYYSSNSPVIYKFETEEKVSLDVNIIYGNN